MASRYQNIETQKSDNGKTIYLPIKYPSLAPSNNDYYIIAREEDRFDLIASDFYGQPTYWWVIVQLRIPGNLSDALSAYNIENSNV